jgi:hypothetical protein
MADPNKIPLDVRIPSAPTAAGTASSWQSVERAGSICQRSTMRSRRPRTTRSRSNAPKTSSTTGAVCSGRSRLDWRVCGQVARRFDAPPQSPNAGPRRRRAEPGQRLCSAPRRAGPEASAGATAYPRSHLGECTSGEPASGSPVGAAASTESDSEALIAKGEGAQRSLENHDQADRRTREPWHLPQNAPASPCLSRCRYRQATRRS